MAAIDENGSTYYESLALPTVAVPQN